MKQAIQEAEAFYSAFVGEEGCCPDDNVLTLDEYDESLDEIAAMKEYAISIDDIDEVKFWTRMYRKVQNEKRNLIAKMRKDGALVATA